MRNEKSPIAVEGIPFLAGTGLVTVVLVLLAGAIPFCWIFALVSLILTGFVAFFFRNPVRNAPADDRAIIAPADGVVIYLGPAREEHLGEEMTKISIFMSVFNVHINRVPMTGTVEDSFYVKGKFLDVRDQRASFENEQSGLIVRNDRGTRIVVVQVAGLIARRIVCYVTKGDRLVRGKRYGLIRFGSRLDVYLPREVAVQVKMGDKTIAGETILGLLP
ncbi:phosphatidylserine decarboxylase proenzyme [Geotalea uraniireducens]|uniref:Phosphatidylserine decarboxylase proenzyme n=1 Tax=Geotalea uraniireducens TaxID=351604 RepID=A0ABN6VT20_9BACT|nr:phosphatidylserine decarboxylase family protein [Geotalea uraniireducens]BDV43509.1 phosphatidylserine decarboxylase proenzyme [Geotalea uraniireducens]